jgi:YD repeat-containing protein
MASWRLAALVGWAALGLFACSGKSTSDDDDSGGQAGAGGSGGSGASGGSGGSGGSTTPPPACGALTSAQAGEIATRNIAAVLRATVDATRFTEGSSFINRVVHGGRDASDPFQFANDADQSIDDIVKSLTTDVFPLANVESQTDSTITFHQTAAVNCPLDEEWAMSDPEYAAQDQQYCIQDLNAHPIRYVVSRVGCAEGDAVSIALVVETAKITEGVLTAYPSSLVLNLDVANLVKATQASGNTTAFDQDAAGQMTFKLDTATAGKAAFTAALANQLVFGETDNDDHVRLTLAASTKAAEVTADSSTGTVKGSLSAGALGAVLPFHTLIESAFNRDVTSSVSPTDSVEVAVPGASAVFEFDRATDRLSLSGLGLGGGSSTVKSGTATLLTVDVNPSDGRRFALDLGIAADGQMTVAPNPGFELDLGYSMGPVASKVVSLEPFALNDTVTFSLAGSSPSGTLLTDVDGALALPERVNGSEVRIDAGSFAMTSVAYPTESVHVAQGQCLNFDGSRSGQHDILRGYFAGNCVLAGP